MATEENTAHHAVRENDIGRGRDAEPAQLAGAGREAQRQERRRRWDQHFRLACEIAGLLASIATVVTLILVFL